MQASNKSCNKWQKKRSMWTNWINILRKSRDRRLFWAKNSKWRSRSLRIISLLRRAHLPTTLLLIRRNKMNLKHNWDSLCNWLSLRRTNYIHWASSLILPNKVSRKFRPRRRDKIKDSFNNLKKKLVLRRRLRISTKLQRSFIQLRINFLPRLNWFRTRIGKSNRVRD